MTEHKPSDSPKQPSSIRTIRFRLTDAGNAKRLVARYRDRIRYCYDLGQWLVWTGTRWRPDARGELTAMALTTAEAIEQEATQFDDEDRKRFAKHAHSSASVGRVRAMVELARVDPAITVAAHRLDSDPWLLNCLNGTIDLRTGELRGHDQRDLITKLAPVRYDPVARFDLWDRFLAKATGDDAELADYLQRLFGYALVGVADEKAFYFLHGPPNTGKSTVLDAWSAVLGDYAVDTDFSTWTGSTQPGNHRDDLMRIRGARLVVASEVGREARFNGELVTRVTGGDAITAAAKYQSTVSFRPSCTLVMAANELPAIRLRDSGMWDRCHRVPFEHWVRKPDKSVKRQLTDRELAGPAVLAWGIKGCSEWRRRGLERTAQIAAATRQYEQQMDPVTRFLQQRCVRAPSAKTTRKELRRVYELWCVAVGEQPLSDRGWTKALKERDGIAAKRSGSKRYWLGVRLIG